MFKKFLLLFLVIGSLASCKTEYEKIRSSNDPVKILQAAHENYEKEEWYTAQTLYELAIPFYRGKKEAEDLFYRFAYTHYNLNEFILSAHYFKTFSTSFYNSPKREECDYMSAYSNYKLSPSYKLDQSHSQKAIDAFQRFVNTYPTSDRVALCNQYIDEIRAKMELKAFDQGLLYYNMKQYNSAIYSFESMLKDFPSTSKGEEVRYIMIKAGYDFAENSIYEKKSERYQSVLNDLKKFNKKYPTSKYKRELVTIENDSLSKYTKYKS